MNDIENKFEELLKIKLKFQPYIRDPKWFYTYIAPQNKKLYDKFILIVSNYPSNTLYQVLSDINIVKNILLNNFDNDIDLEIYISTKDITSLMFTGTLDEYIAKEKIDFKI
jgi:hypothetical protein